MPARLTQRIRWLTRTAAAAAEAQVFRAAVRLVAGRAPGRAGRADAAMTDTDLAEELGGTIRAVGGQPHPELLSLSVIDAPRELLGVLSPTAGGRR